MFRSIFTPENWSAVPFHFWSVVFFVFGSVVGSFLNVCIHRLPLGESIVSPPSHCPHCKYSIPWLLNLPLITWLSLRGRCRNCGAPISVRYFLVELLTALMFMSSWLAFGRQSVLVALIYALFLAGLIAATFIDFEHFIIPDQITIGGMVVGVVCSLVAPALHGQISRAGALTQSLIGFGLGGRRYLLHSAPRKAVVWPAKARVAARFKNHLHRNRRAPAGEGNSLRRALLSPVRYHRAAGADRRVGGPLLQGRVGPPQSLRSADWRGEIESGRGAAPGSDQRGNYPAARGDGVGRR